MSKVKKYIDSVMSQLKLARKMVREEKKALQQARKDLHTALEAQKLIQVAAAEIQTSAHQRISKLVTQCLRMIFGSKYTFKINFEQKRGKTQARMVFLDKEGDEIDPTTESGGGVVDIAAFGLRLAALILSKPQPAKVLVLDEPFRFVSRGLADKVRKLIEALSEELDIQFIIVTHDPRLEAGKVIEVR